MLIHQFFRNILEQFLAYVCQGIAKKRWFIYLYTEIIYYLLGWEAGERE